MCLYFEEGTLGGGHDTVGQSSVAHPEGLGEGETLHSPLHACSVEVGMVWWAVLFLSLIFCHGSSLFFSDNGGN